MIYGIISAIKSALYSAAETYLFRDISDDVRSYWLGVTHLHMDCIIYLTPLYVDV